MASPANDYPVPKAAVSPSFSWRNRARRLVWNLFYLLCFRPSPRPCHGWRRFCLRLFSAEVAPGAHIYPAARIWAPWNLSVGAGAAIADQAEVYNPSRITIGDFAVVSQGAYLCGASHDYTKWDFPLISGPIVIERYAWVAARAIVRMDIVIGEGCVIGAGSVVTKNMPAWTVCAGNPCRIIRPYEKAP